MFLDNLEVENSKIFRGYAPGPPKGPCKKYVTPEIAMFDPHPPLSHLVIFLPNPLPHVTHQKVRNSDPKIYEK